LCRAALASLQTGVFQPTTREIEGVIAVLEVLDDSAERVVFIPAFKVLERAGVPASIWPWRPIFEILMLEDLRAIEAEMHEEGVKTMASRGKWKMERTWWWCSKSDS
jgi:hypothetical protein